MRVCLDCGAETDGLFCPTDGMATIVADRHPTSTQLQPQTIFASRYRIVGTLGRGGMGTVYDALHTGTGQKVAIKTLLIDVAHEPQAVKRFFYEAKLTASLQHPNTIRVFDFGQSDEGIFYLVMERLQGETLGDRLLRYSAEGHPMAESEAASIGVGVLRSLGEAHRVNLVHRDLKPGNIFLHDIGGGETVVKVLDFGIAKHGESHLTQTGTSLGTPSYMSPEQVMGQGIDGRSDLYSLGIVLYQCVSGTMPFPGESSYTVMMKQVHEPAPDLSELGTASKGFAHIVRQAMAKKVEDRYPTAQALREALEPVARGEIVQAPGAIEDRPTQALATGSLPVPPPARTGLPPATPSPKTPPPPSPPPAPGPPASGARPAPPPAAAPSTKVASRPPGGPRQHPEPAPPRAQSDVPVALVAAKKSTFLPILVIGLALIAISLAVAWWLHGAGNSPADQAGADAGAQPSVDAAPAAVPTAADVAAAVPAPDVAPVAPDTAAADDADTADTADAADAQDASDATDVLAAADESAAAPDVASEADVAKAGAESGLLPPGLDKPAGGDEPDKPAKVAPKKPVIQWKHVWEHKGYRPPSSGGRPSAPGTRPSR